MALSRNLTYLLHHGFTTVRECTSLSNTHRTDNGYPISISTVINLEEDVTYIPSVLASSTRYFPDNLQDDSKVRLVCPLEYTDTTIERVTPGAVLAQLLSKTYTPGRLLCIRHDGVKYFGNQFIVIDEDDNILLMAAQRWIKTSGDTLSYIVDRGASYRLYVNTRVIKRVGKFERFLYNQVLPVLSSWDDPEIVISPLKDYLIRPKLNMGIECLKALSDRKDSIISDILENDYRANLL